MDIFPIPPVAKQQLEVISTLVMVVLQRGWYNRLDQLFLREDWHVFFVVAAVLCRIVATLRENQRRSMTVREGSYRSEGSPPSILRADGGPSRANPRLTTT